VSYIKHPDRQLWEKLCTSLGCSFVVIIEPENFGELAYHILRKVKEITISEVFFCNTVVI